MLPYCRELQPPYVLLGFAHARVGEDPRRLRGLNQDPRGFADGLRKWPYGTETPSR